MKKVFDYDRLPEEQQIAIANNIGNDNREKSNRFYPSVNIKSGFYALVVKRIIDIAVSALALIVFFPVNIVIGVITYFDVGFPLFFKQVRMGKKCKPFTMVKFRNMTEEKDDNGILLRADLRVTKWGKIARATSLDELLNFFNVLKGDMSIIGPRPLPLIYMNRFNDYHELRHAVKPGLDCPLCDPNKPMTWENRLNNDVWYVQNVSFSTDVKLVWLLVKKVLFGRDKTARADGFDQGTFMGYYDDGSVMDSNHIPPQYYEDYMSFLEE